MIVGTKRSSLPASRLSAQSFESLIRLAPVGIFVTDSRGRITFINDRWTEISGLSAAGNLGHGWTAAIHPDDRGRVTKEWLACASEGRPCTIDYRVVHSSGEIRRVQVRGVPLFTPTGRPGGLTGTLDETADRAGAEPVLRESLAALEFSRDRLRALFEYSLDAIVLADDSGQYVEVNPAACELLGAPREALLASRVHDLAMPELAEAFDKGWRAFLTIGERSGEYALRRQDGTTRDVEFRAVAHVLPGMHLAILRDVTERVRLDRVRRQYVQRLEVLSAIDHAILDARSIMTVADVVVRMVGALFPTIRVSLMLFDWRTRNARHVAVWSQEPTRLGVGTEMAMRDDVVGPEVLAGRSVIRSHLEGQAELTWLDQMLFNEGVCSLLRVPLRGSAEVIGALNISSSRSDGFDEDTLVVAQEVADRVAIAITGAKLFEDLQAGAAHLAVVSKRLVEVQEVERRDVARELHDEIGQLLTGVKLRLDLAVKGAAPPIAESLAECVELVQELVSRVRRLSLNLRPPLLDELGLEKALVAHFDRYTAQTSVHVLFSSSGLADQRLAVVVETATFRIVQESLTNVARHADVEVATVEVRVADKRVYVTVADRGRGFAGDISTSAGAGLSGMRERITLLGGVFDVSSVPGEGTTVEAQIPFPAPGGGQP